MFNIQKRLQNKTQDQPKAVSVDLRQRLLQKEFENFNKLPDGCSLSFENPDVLSQFKVKIVPDRESLWHGGQFEFVVNVPESYNMEPPKVHCLTTIWHPNINEKGDVCLSILRQNALDSYGWLPTRTIIEVIFGINSLFYDLVNFDDPLNTEASTQYQTNKDKFIQKVKDYISKYSVLKRV